MASPNGGEGLHGTISYQEWYVGMGTDQRLYTILPNIIAIGLYAEHAGWCANHQGRCDVSGLMTV